MLNRIASILVLLIIFHSANAGIVVSNGLTHIHKIESGNIVKGKISIQNTGTEAQNVKIYLQDLSYKSDGTIIYAQPNTHNKSNTSWIKLATNFITLKAGEKTDLLYEITAPDSIENAGSYWSVLIVEPVKEIPLNNQSGVNITSVVRYAIQIITNYKTEDLKSDLKFESVKIVKEENRNVLKVAIANTGNIYCKTVASIELFNAKTGQKAGVFSSLPMSLLPNNSKMFSIDIGKILPGQYSTVIMASDEEENSFALKTELNIRND